MEKSLTETANAYKKTMDFTRVLVIKISSLGDIILSAPSLKALKTSFPCGTVTVLTLKKYAPILYDCPYVDEIITLENDYKKIKNIIDIAKKLRMKAFDYIVDLQNSRASHLISFLSFPRYSFGYSLRLGFLLTKRLRLDRNLDPLSSQEKILELLGLRMQEKKLTFWDIKTDTQDKIFNNEKKLIGINISASTKWQTKNWPMNNIISLCALINKNFPFYRIVLLGDQTAKETADKIESYLSPKPYNLCGKTSLQDLPAIIKNLKAFITPDTATLHLAEAIGIPTIALFGPTDPRRHTVKSDNLYVFCKELLCSFCYKPKCKLREKTPCMEKITAQEVFSKINEIITKQN
jgi:lipopolysaccharide heptosyltransferase II